VLVRNDVCLADPKYQLSAEGTRQVLLQHAEKSYVGLEFVVGGD